MQPLEQHIQQRLGAAMQTLAFIEQRGHGAAEGRRWESLLRQCRQLVADLDHGFALLQEATSEQAGLRRQVEAASTRAGLLFELSQIPCVIVYESGVIVEANAAATRLLNTSLRYLQDKSFELFLGEKRDAFLAWLGQVSRSTTRERRLVVLRPREQRPKPALIVATPETEGRLALVVMDPQHFGEELESDDGPQEDALADADQVRSITDPAASR